MDTNKKVFRGWDLVFSFPWGIGLLVLMGMFFQGLQVAGYPQMWNALRSITGIEALKWSCLIWLAGWPLAYLGFAAVRASQVIEELRRDCTRKEDSLAQYRKKEQQENVHAGRYVAGYQSLHHGLFALMGLLMKGAKSPSAVVLRGQIDLLYHFVRDIACTSNEVSMPKSTFEWEKEFNKIK